MSFADSFDRSPELKAKGKHEVIELVSNVILSHVKCIFVRQSQPLGFWREFHGERGDSRSKKAFLEANMHLGFGGD